MKIRLQILNTFCVIRMETSQKSIEEGHIALSLISQFCDSRLKEMSNKCTTEKLTKQKQNYLYSDILATAAGLSSNQNERSSQELSSSSAESSQQIPTKDFLRIITPEDLNVSIKRKINLSKHINIQNQTEWESGEPDKVAVNPKETKEQRLCNSHEKQNCITHLKLLAKERLESYLPVLKQRINSGKYSGLKTVPSLQSFINNSCERNNGCEFMTQKDDFGRPQTDQNETHIRPTMDIEQGLFNYSSEDSMVFYGMIEKPSAIKPLRLKRLFECIGVASLPLESMMTSQKQLYLIDGTARIRLIDLSGKLKVSQSVTGMIVGIIGKVRKITLHNEINFEDEFQSEILHVEDVIFPTPLSPMSWPLSKQDNIEMVYISGLHLGNEAGSNLSLDLLQDYLLGLSGSVYEQSSVLAPRIRLFLLGNMIGKYSSPNKAKWKETMEYNVKAMEKLDNFLEPLLRVMEVFLIPGDNDPIETATFPNSPIHRKMFPQSQMYSTLKTLPNPARVHISISQSECSDEDSPPSSSITPQVECSPLESPYADFVNNDIDFIDILFQSGRNLRQTMDYCDISCPIEMGIQLLKWGHLHPTYCDINSVLAQNIFRLKGSLPHVVAIGNLSEFKCVDWNGSKVIGIPAFHKSHTAVTFTKDFNVLPISFKLM